MPKKPKKPNLMKVRVIEPDDFTSKSAKSAAKMKKPVRSTTYADKTFKLPELVLSDRLHSKMNDVFDALLPCWIDVGDLDPDGLTESEARRVLHAALYILDTNHNHRFCRKTGG